MKKLESLRLHLLNSPLHLKEDSLLTYAEKGKVISYQGQDNSHFELRYSAIIIITDYAGSAEQVAYFALQWLKEHQPNAQEDSLEFEADILSHQAVDLSLKLDLSEVIQVEVKEDGVHFHSMPEPRLYEFLNPAGSLDITTKANGE